MHDARAKLPIRMSMDSWKSCKGRGAGFCFSRCKTAIRTQTVRQFVSHEPCPEREWPSIVLPWSGFASWLGSGAGTQPGAKKEGGEKGLT